MATSTFDMRLSGGHPALDFANTVDSRRGRWGPDFLRSFDDLLVFAERTAMLDSASVSSLREKAAADPERAHILIEEAVKLREAVYQAFVAEDAGRPYPASALLLVETVAREGRSREQLARTETGFAWSLPFDELEDVGRAFALTATELLIARNDRRDVRECKGNNCGWLFLDHSKGGPPHVVLGRQLRRTQPDRALSDTAQVEVAHVNISAERQNQLRPTQISVRRTWRHRKR